MLAGVSAGAGTFLWIVLWWPVPYRVVPLVAATGTLVLLFVPATLLGLFYLGLRDLLVLPDRVAARASKTAQQSAAAARPIRTEPSSIPGRLVTLVRRIWDLRSVLLENRALIAHYGALLRFITPAFLLLVVLAAALSAVLIVLAAGVGLVLFFW